MSDVLSGKLEIYGRRKGWHTFCTLSISDKSFACVSANRKNDIRVVTRSRKTVAIIDGDHAMKRNYAAIKALLPDSCIVLIQNNILFAVFRGSPPMKYNQINRNPSFDALYRIASTRCETVLDFCHLCRLCSRFRCHTQSSVDPYWWHKWSSWHKMVMHLMTINFWVKYSRIPFTQYTAKWLAKISRRLADISDEERHEDDVATICEILLTERDHLGIVYRTTRDNSVDYVSPMIVSKNAFRDPLADVARIECNEWLPLYVDKEHFTRCTFECFLSEMNATYNRVLSVLDFLASARLDNVKHNFIRGDMQTLGALLKPCT